jgi:hypothetical protein
MRIVGILILFLLAAGCTMNGGTPLSTHPGQITASETSSQNQTSSELDSYCEIQEFNRTIIYDYTIVPLTEEDLKPYPEFGQNFESGNYNTQAWRNDGTRPVAYFDCNESAATQFYSLSRKYEEFPNQPIFEYNGHYYKVSFNSYIWHSRTAEPTLSPDTSATGTDQNNGSSTGYS